MSVVYTAQVDGANRRRVVRSALTAVALIYVAILLLAPLGGIVAGVLSAGLDVVGETFALPDVRHALWLTAVITTIRWKYGSGPSICCPPIHERPECR